LVLQQALLDSIQELFGLPECQAQMLDALGVLLQGDEVGDGFFMAIIAAYDELEFDVHGKTPPGLIGGGMMQTILPEFVDSPQHLHALVLLRRLINHLRDAEFFKHPRHQTQVI
jgi:hypothetical protein